LIIPSKETQLIDPAGQAKPYFKPTKADNYQATTSNSCPKWLQTKAKKFLILQIKFLGGTTLLISTTNIP
jgi:hypothetical protein